MQLTKFSALLVLAYCTVSSGSPVEINAISATNTAEIKALVSSFEQFNSEFALVKRDGQLDVPLNQLVTRADVPILQSILSGLNNSGLALIVIDYVLLRPELLDITIDATIWVIESGLINLTDLLIALEQSGLIIDVLMLSLSDPDILPGLLRIGRELLKQSGIDIFSKRDAFAEAVSTESPEQAFAELSKRESEVMNSLFTALRESGLALSVVQHLLTTPELAAPNAHFLLSILRSNALSLTSLLNALKQSNLIWNLLRDILGNPDVLSQFGQIIADRIAKGIIPKNLFDDA
ncbi:uncharacterized protein SPAPADRAFT_155078 [Spathaspora passalidarum NRRL Y-27907]|uniref:Uncharacterized protein n=1 Tax=Spathaspora passalidarum (strain NRRL Y-27907 / 11-Y1) TaxID=619300 RepID=G3AQT6_SPAPN|nr:uncharacterized protein SPAPADRAFT_155078 [Spathaspora passalidarum NRRL Y-27907]EGW31633.1 hypothetical protein SPAPADRAFT_155078 [Spathaspora passalidarum NRRL Y-27907]